MARISLNLPRKVSRLPRIGRVRNPFKAGTSTTAKRVKRALATHGAALAANNIPGKAVAAGAVGAKLGGPASAAAAFGATEAASVAASALLARSIARRGKAAAYLSRRSKRKTGVYKMADALASLDIIAKAGLIKPGKPHILRRIGFLITTARNERKAKIGRYLESRKRGLGYGPKNKRGRYTRRRVGTYTGVYATGVNKSGAAMNIANAISALSVIEKAKGLIRGGSKRTMRAFQRRAAARKLSGKGKSYAFRDGYLSTRVKGGRTGQGFQPDGRFRTLIRSGRYK